MLYKGKKIVYRYSVTWPRLLSKYARGQTQLIHETVYMNVTTCLYLILLKYLISFFFRFAGYCAPKYLNIAVNFVFYYFSFLHFFFTFVIKRYVILVLCTKKCIQPKQRNIYIFWWYMCLGAYNLTAFF